MADDKKEAAKEQKTGKEAKKDAVKETAAAAGTKASGGAMGAIAAGVVLLVLGGGIGVGGSMVVAKWSGSAAGEGGDKALEVPTEKKAEHGKEIGLHDLTEITLPDLMSNIKNQQGRRYIKISCSVWIEKLQAVTLGLAKAGGGHGGGGGDTGSEVKRIMQQALEEHLKNYDIEELTGPNIYLQLKKGFRDALERALHEIYTEMPENHRVVERIVLTNLLVQ